MFPESDIDKFHDYRLDACPECNNPDVVFLNRPPRVIQQMELKKVMMLKEEHRSYPVWCERCGKIHYHSFPEHVVKGGLFKVIHNRENLDEETFNRAMEHARTMIMNAALVNVSSQLDGNGKELKRGPFNMAHALCKDVPPLSLSSPLSTHTSTVSRSLLYCPPWANMPSTHADGMLG